MNVKDSWGFTLADVCVKYKAYNCLRLLCDSHEGKFKGKTGVALVECLAAPEIDSFFFPPRVLQLVNSTRDAD